MAKISPKGKTVIGTNKKDKIIWANKSAWKKALTVNAGKGNDTIDFSKSKYKNILNGQDGNDIIYGGLKNDKITGGKGKDTIYTGKGSNTIIINKGDGNDTIYNQGSKLTIKFNNPNTKDKITAFEKKGSDLIVTCTHAKAKGEKKAVSEVLTFKNYYNPDGTIANDNIYIAHKKTVKLSYTMENWKISGVNNEYRGTSNADTITGTDGNDIIYGNAGNDKIYGKNGNDKIDGGEGNDLLYGNDGNDIINARKGNDTVYGGYGDDVLTGGDGNDLIYGDDGNDLILGELGNDALYGGNGNDTILGHEGNDVLMGGDGDDSIEGNDGNDTIYGDAGNDVINAGSGNDYIEGGAGDDTIKGISGNNTILGGNGNDFIYSGSGNNTINGGDGVDYIDVTNGTNTIIFDNLTYNYDDTKIETIAGFKNDDILQINTLGGMDIYPISIDSKTRDLYLGAYANSINIKIADYSNETRNGWISVNGSESMKMSDFLTQNLMYIYTNNADILSNISSGTYFTLDGNDVLTGNINEGYYSGISVYAGNGNDSITNMGATDYTCIYGEDGDDTITTSSAEMHQGFLYGGAGNDVITANDSLVKVTIYGDEGDDILTGGRYIDGGTGNDTITSSRTGDVELSTNATYIYGGEGDDEIHVYNTHYNNVIYNFYLNQSDGNDVIYDDLVSIRQLRFMQRNKDKSFFDMVNEIRYAKNGNDLIIKYKDNNSDLYRNSITIKNYMISENQTNLRFYDSSGDYQLVKTFIDTHGIELNGTDGDDIINGSANADAIYAGDGDDFIYAGRGNDRIHTGSGNNTIVFYNNYYYDGNNNFDTLNDGNDIVYTDGGGVDTLDFGQAIAVKYAKSDNDLVISYNFNPASYWEARSSVTLKGFYDDTVNNSTHYIKLLGHDAIELNPEELTPEAITAHNNSIHFDTDSMSFTENVDLAAYGGNNSTYFNVYSTAGGTYYFNGEMGEYDVYTMNTLIPKVNIYDSDNHGIVNIYSGKFSSNNIFYDMQVTVENGVVTGCDYNSLWIYAPGQFDKGVRVWANPNLAGVTDGTPAQSISYIQDGYSNKLTDISALAQTTAAWIASNKEDGVYSTSALVSEGGDDAAAILALASGYINWQNP